MPMVADPTQPQRRRRTETVPENVTFEREAHDILMHYRPPGWHGTRIFIEWLIDDHDTRAQGREPLPSLPHIARGGMPTIAASTRTQRSRRPDVITKNITVHRRTSDILKGYCPPGTRSKGRFLSRLLYEHHARVQVLERAHKDMVQVSVKSMLSKQEFMEWYQWYLGMVKYPVQLRASKGEERQSE